MFPQDREQLRQFYLQTWEKAQQGDILNALEQQITQVIKEHPEYHPALSQPTAIIDKDYFPEQGDSNPFLHMGLHLGLREQIATDRPAGIQSLYLLWSADSEAHDIEHQMMECLAESIWIAQQKQSMPDEAAYMACLHQLRNKKS